MQRALAGARLSLIALLAAALSAGLGLMPLPGAATAADSGNAAHLHAYTYDAKPASASPPQATTERPPTAIDDTAYSAVDRWSGGASARFGSAATLGAHTYDDTARLAQVASGIAPTETSGRATCRPSVAFHRHGVAANAGALEARANSLHGVLDPIAQNSRTAAALGTREGTTVLGSGGRDLSPAQRALVGDGEIVARSPGAHAEVTAVNGARDAGLTPLGIGVSRPICPACIEFLEEAGATITSPTTAWWW